MSHITQHIGDSYKAFELTFDGTEGKGQAGIPFNWPNVEKPSIISGFFIYEVFYRVTTPLVSATPATDNITFGIDVDEPDSILNSTNGIIDTLNANATGIKIEPKYTKSTDVRDLVLNFNGNDITAGTIEFKLKISHCISITTEVE